MDEELKRKQFMALLVKEAEEQGAQTDEEIEAYIKNLGEDAIRERYAKFELNLEGNVLTAKLGAKLNYLRALKGKCPEGEEVVYFKKGGKNCSACKKAQEGNKLNAVQEFKKKRKLAKGCKA